MWNTCSTILRFSSNSIITRICLRETVKIKQIYLCPSNKICLRYKGIGIWSSRTPNCANVSGGGSLILDQSKISETRTNFWQMVYLAVLFPDSLVHMQYACPPSVVHLAFLPILVIGFPPSPTHPNTSKKLESRLRHVFYVPPNLSWEHGTH